MRRMLSLLWPSGTHHTAQDVRYESVTGLPHTEPLESPYIAARREWNERYGDSIARAYTWQKVAIGSMAVSMILACFVGYLGTQSKVRPFVVAVDHLGASVAVRPADQATVPDPRIIRYQLAQFISQARSITPDPVVQKRWLDGVYAMVRPGAKAFLDDGYQKHDPFRVAKERTVSVDVQSALPLSANTWQVQWKETARSLSGQVEGITQWSAVLTLTVITPTTEEQIVANPSGLFVEQIHWTRQM